MIRHFTFLTLGVLAGAATAQTTYNFNVIREWDQSTEYTSRANVRGSAGHESQAFPRGVLGGLVNLTRVQFVMQDQNLATQEGYNFRVSPLSASGQPDYASGVNLNNTLLTLPTGTGIGAYLVTLTFVAGNGKPVNLDTIKNSQNKPLLNPYEGIHFGWQFVKGANWTSDGISVHMSQAGRQLPNGGQGNLTCWQNRFHREIPRPEKFATSDPTNQIIERLAWSTNSGQAGSSYLDRSWRLDLFFNEPTLQGAADNTTYNNSPCKNPNTGYAALDPDFNDKGKATVKRYDDYVWTVQSNAHIGGVGVLFLSTSVLSTPLSLPGIGGKLFINPGDPLMALGAFPLGTISNLGSGQFKLALGAGGANNTLRKVITQMPAIHAQAYLVKVAGGLKLDFSNVWTLRPMLDPDGTGTAYSRATTISGTPIKLTKKVTDRTLYVRNDGLDEIEVRQYIGASTTPIRKDKIFSRMGVRVILFPAATRVEIVTTKTSKVDVMYGMNL